MPVHTIPAAHLHEDLLQIQREGERIVQVIPNGRRRFTVLTEWPDREIRPAHRLAGFTHAARVGAVELRAEWDRDPLLHSFLGDQIVVDGDA